MAVIGKIRKRSGLLIGVIILAIIGFLLMDGLNSNSSLLTGGAGPGAIGVVDGHEIDYNTFNLKVEENVENFKRQNGIQGSIGERQRLEIREQTWQEFVEESILEEAYAKLGIKVTDEEVVDMIQGEFKHPAIISSFSDQQTGQFNQQALNQYLSTLDQENNPEDLPGTKRANWLRFEQAMREDRALNKFSSLVSNGFYVPNWQAEMNYQAQQAQVTFKYTTVPFYDIPDESIEVTEKDMQAYLTKHESQFKQEPSRQMTIAMFPVTPSKADSLNTLSAVNTNFEEWKTHKNDSIFINLRSDRAFNPGYLTAEELNEQTGYGDTILASAEGAYIGPYLENGAYGYMKVLDKKSVPDSVKARHILISFEDVQSQEQFDARMALVDSLYMELDSMGGDFAALANAYSMDPGNTDQMTGAKKGGDLGWAKPGMMVPNFNDAIFYRGDVGKIMKVPTEFGFHIVQVTDKGGANPAAKVAFLEKQIIPSEDTDRNIYAAASQFSGNNQTKDAFTAAVAEMPKYKVRKATVSKDDNFIDAISQESARELIKWSFTAQAGQVSAVYSVGSNYVVALIEAGVNEGKPTVKNLEPQLKVAVMREKKAEQITEQMSGAKGASIEATATSLNKEIMTATSSTFQAGLLNGGILEPKVVAAAFATAQGQQSEPIVGNTGVFIVQPISSTSPPQLENYGTYKNQMTTQLNSRLNINNSELLEAMKKAAEVEDNRFDFY